MNADNTPSTPSPEQAEIIRSNTHWENGPSWDLVIANPGSGKSFTLIERIKYLVEDERDTAKFVVITFTNAAAKSLRTRLGDIKVGFVGTIHSWMLTVIHRVLAAVAIVIDEFEQQSILNEIIASGPYRVVKGKVREAVQKIVETRDFSDTSTAGLVAKEYFNRTLARGVLDYDSILWLGLLYLKTLQKIRDEITRSVDFLFVDEFQDTSKVDFEIYKTLRELIRCHFYVGDPDQAIYGFRGSDHTGIIQLSKLAGVNTHYLPVNYRSKDAIVSAAQELISNNKVRLDKVMTTKQVGGDITVTTHQTVGQEVKAMTDLILPNHAAGKTKAVLVRTNALVDLYSGMLSSWNIPVVKASPALQTSADVQKAIKAILMLSNPNNDDIMRSWIAEEKGAEFAKSIALSAMRQFIPINKITGGRVPVGLGTRLWHELYALAIPPDTVVGLQHVASQLSTGDGIPELIVAIQEEQRTEITPTEPGVAVLTMHSAKGLEFDIVFLPAFEQHIIPGKKTGEVLEEERRLAFVALTRARSEVHISHISERKDSWKAEEIIRAAPSQFIDEMGL